MLIFRKSVLLVLILFCVVPIRVTNLEASLLQTDDPLERAKQATVGVLQHDTDSSHHTAQSQFAIRGSGVHVGEGYILTARHAVERQVGGKTTIPQQISIMTSQLSEYPAVFIGVSGFLDMALYRIKTEARVSELAFAPYSKKTPHQGDEVFTVGYPLGWGPALAFGRLGNTHTYLPTAQTRLMQVDLSACSGNSGGGLFNAKGELIGLVHAIIQSQSQEQEKRCSRFAFAVPGSLVERHVTAMREGKSPKFSKLGIRMTVVKVAQQWRVAVAKAKGPARRAGVRKHDVLLSVNGKPIASAAQLKSYLIEHTEPGQTIELRILRDEREKTLTIRLGAA